MSEFPFATKRCTLAADDARNIALEFTCRTNPLPTDPQPMVVPLDFARQLECDLIHQKIVSDQHEKERGQIGGLKLTIAQKNVVIDNLERELRAVRAERERWHDAAVTVCETKRKIKRTNRVLRTLLETLDKRGGLGKETHELIRVTLNTPAT